MQVLSDRSRWKSIGEAIFSSGQQQADMMMMMKSPLLGHRPLLCERIKHNLDTRDLSVN